MYWITGFNKKKEPYIRGPYLTELRAQAALDKQDVDGKIVRLPTRNTAAATRMAKERKLWELSFEEATKRFRHPK